MAIIKCKMCGGDLDFRPGETVAECEYCGTLQTVPSGDNEKKLTFFARANRLRAACEFDTAAAVYEQIIAEFPSEAEAYWGLVLCKYGIEYVDDPGTGKKIPTCHRSSFDSVLTDVNFDLAVANADVVARRVYRREAEELERIRQGILSVSSSEAPYDIFICYKETDSGGNRTVDSVLAQDIYDTLTDKGYRVFFSRISLEDKLGQAYEPYIFAALNSAKIMLAVGTSFENYNAVWVKNEWSRYLKIISQDKSKHLFPCYKNIDPYDMPREFAHLQGQDMGKVGAMQDLIRGIEKHLPRNTAPVRETVVRERVVVQQSFSDPGTAALVTRGKMALEDKAWAKADKFFEDALNRDAECAEAYLGKVLAQERCGSLSAMVTQHISACVQAEEQKALINEKTDKFLGDVLSKTAELAGAISADVGDKAAGLCDLAKRYLVSTPVVQKVSLPLDIDRTQQAAEESREAREKVKAAYADFLDRTDKMVAQLHKDLLVRREEDYQTLIQTGETETDGQSLLNVADALTEMGEFKDARLYAAKFRKKGSDAREEEAMEADRVRYYEAQERERKKAKKKRNRRIVIFTVVALFAAMVAIGTVGLNNDYAAADALLAAGQYAQAAQAFRELDTWKDSADRALEASYLYGKELLANKDYDAAREIFQSLGDYQDSRQLVAEMGLAQQYQAAEALLDAGKTAEAAIAFGKMGDYQDARARSYALWNEIQVNDTIDTGAVHTVALKENGTVVATGSNKFGQCNTSKWTDIVSISVNGWHTVALKSDGTVLAIGNNEYDQCNVSEWKDIRYVSAGGLHTVGIKSDYTVVAVGENVFGPCNVSDWKDIVAISAGDSHTVGLKSDGTVVAVGLNDNGQCDVSDWENIVMLVASGSHTVGLKADGTVVATGDNKYGQCDVSEWRDVVSISCGNVHTVGLKTDGTVVAIGNKEYGQCDVADWANIAAIAADNAQTIRLQSDGKVIAVGYNKDGQCNVQYWTDIAVPERLPIVAPEQTGVTASAAMVGPLRVVNSAAVFVGNDENP